LFELAVLRSGLLELAEEFIDAVEASDWEICAAMHCLMRRAKANRFVT
jgi:hypothetical protein